jgi:hypothetical protein
MHLVGVDLISMHLISVDLTGMHLRGVYRHVSYEHASMGVYLMGVHLTGMYLIGTYRRASHWHTSTGGTVDNFTNSPSPELALEFAPLIHPEDLLCSFHLQHPSRI